jgi:hypothetical protein
MSGAKRRKNQFREALDAKREALTRAANEPKPEKQPEWEPVPGASSRYRGGGRRMKPSGQDRGDRGV